MIAYRRARAAAAAVRQQRQVGSRFKVVDLRVRREQTELHEMVSAPARAELRPGTILVLLGDRADCPIRVQHIVRVAFLETLAHTKACLLLDGTSESVLS